MDLTINGVEQNNRITDQKFTIDNLNFGASIGNKPKNPTIYELSQNFNNSGQKFIGYDPKTVANKIFTSGQDAEKTINEFETKTK